MPLLLWDSFLPGKHTVHTAVVARSQYNINTFNQHIQLFFVIYLYRLSWRFAIIRFLLIRSTKPAQSKLRRSISICVFAVFQNLGYEARSDHIEARSIGMGVIVEE